MYTCIIKRTDDYDIEEFKKDCIHKNLNYEDCKSFFETWKIQQKDVLLGELTNKYRYYNVKINGVVEVDNLAYHVRPKILGFDLAIDEVLTPDLFDFEIYFDDVGDEFTIIGYHDETNINQFVLKLI